MRRHPLPDEVKSELDAAYARVKTVELKVMALEREYNAQADGLEGVAASGGEADHSVDAVRMAEKEQRQDELNIEQAYDHLNGVVSRFSVVSSAFSVVATVPEPSLAPQVLERVLFRRADLSGARADALRELRSFATALRGFMMDEENAPSETDVRGAWSSIETRLKAVGRLS